MSDNVFAVDTSGWVSQNAGRKPWELARESIQNALDSGGDFRVQVNSRSSEFVVEDEGSGFEKLSDVWTIFAGDKGDDPTKRGRFGRGLKELIAGAEYVRVETTCGTVTFTMDREEDKYHKEVAEEEVREVGTKVTARNKNWSTEQINEIREYADKIWVPEGQELMIDVVGGNSRRKKHGDPIFSFEASLETVVVKNGVMREISRDTVVHGRFAGGAGNRGKIYEMGIPVLMDWEVPFDLDVQQRVPMAEQRNEPDSSWLETFVKIFLGKAFDQVPTREYTNDWVKSNIDTYRVSKAAKQQWVEEVYGDNVVTASNEAADDRAQNQGYKVLDTNTMSWAERRAVSEVVESSDSVMHRMLQREESRVEPTPEQERFVEQMLELVGEVDGVPDDITVQFWELAPTQKMEMNSADFDSSENVMRLNVNAGSWDRVNSSTLGTFIHEVAHHEGKGHDHDWYGEMQRIFAELLVERL